MKNLQGNCYLRGDYWFKKKYVNSAFMIRELINGK